MPRWKTRWTASLLHTSEFCDVVSLVVTTQKDLKRMKVRQAVHEFISNLELTEAEREAASRQHTYLRDGLAGTLELDPDYNTFLTGSYSRSTAIRPLKDIDVFCVLKCTEKVNSAKLAPTEALTKIKAALESLYHEKTAKLQMRSVNIQFAGTGIGYDIVPAFVDEDAKGEVFLIPDLHRNTWIRSNPRVHKQKSVDANDRAGTELKPLTKAVKHWNRRQAETNQLRSFHIEIMAWDVLQKKPESRIDGLKALFEGLASRVLTSTPDPAGLGPNLDEDMTEAKRNAAQNRFAQASSIVAEAIQLANDGKTESAHHKLYTLFGDPYPEKGKAEPEIAPKVAIAAVALPTAPDANRSRFG